MRMEPEDGVGQLVQLLVAAILLVIHSITFSRSIQSCSQAGVGLRAQHPGQDGGSLAHHLAQILLAPCHQRTKTVQPAAVVIKT